ncbi:MAG: right-handed parallel beta-helix repeat-containing protein, partial [Phycisphaerales bacterium]|nr:right-handed parallel beta-helix repeat-containing protein [Phycisphaerales bacterium]
MKRYAIGVAVLAVTGSVCAQAVQWTEAEGGNGHWYERIVFDADAGDTFDSIRADAVSRGADLASIHSGSQDEFVANIAQGVLGQGVILGTLNVASSGCSFTWTDGSDWDYASTFGQPPWGGSQPNCQVENTDGQPIGYYDDGWHDLLVQDIAGAMFEWSADCNGDGIVDYGQILDGTYADDNSNGVPDSCELDHIVPDHYPSIQVAIDQTEPGMVIQVRSGTYTENIVSNTPIILRSLDGPEATIIDGNQTGTVVQLAGGQPHAIDGFTVTNGVGPANTAGGILISGGTHLAIRNCIISNNTHIDGEYGGGGLKLNVGSLQMNNCEFHGNSSSWSGGAIYIWHSCCVYITDCTFTNQGHDGTEYGPLDVVHIQNDSTAAITGCVFDGNRFRDSEVVVWAGGLTTVTNCEFLNGEQTEPTQQPKAGSVFSGQAGELAIGSNYACGHPEPHVTIEFTDLGGNEFTDEPCEFT